MSNTNHNNNLSNHHADSRRLSRNSSAGSNSLVPPTRLGSPATSGGAQPSSSAARPTSNRSRHDPGNDSLRPPTTRSSITSLDNDGIYSPPPSSHKRTNGFKASEVPGPPPVMKVSPSEYQSRFLQENADTSEQKKPPTKRAVATRLPPRKENSSMQKQDSFLTSHEFRTAMVTNHNLASRSRLQRQTEQEVLSNSYSMNNEDTSSLLSSSEDAPTTTRDWDGPPVVSPPEKSSRDGPVMAPTSSPAGGTTKEALMSSVAVGVSVGDAAGESTNDRELDETEQQPEGNIANTEDETTQNGEANNDGSDDDLDEKHYYSAPPLAAAVDEHGQAYPGAYTAPGRAVGSFPVWGRAVPLPIDDDNMASNNEVIPQVSGHLASEEQEIAVIVEETPPFVVAEASPPVVAQPCSDEFVYSEDHPKPWWRKKSIWLCVAILVAVAVGVGVAIPLVFGGDDSESSSDETQEEVPSPAPTLPALVTITAVIKLDDRPEETGWWLECGSEEVFAVEAGEYRDPGELISEKADVLAGEECELTVEDDGGDGIEGGFIRAFSGTDIFGETPLLSETLGDFGTDVTFSFEAPDAISTRPTPSPTTQVPVGIQPTTKPSTSTQVPVEESIDVEIFIRFDRFPHETSWTLKCDDNGVNIDVPPFTYTGQREASEVIQVSRGSQCRFAIFDSEWDGICCRGGEGFFQVSLANVVVAEGGEFGRVQVVDFRADPPIVAEDSDLVSATVLVVLDAFPSETSWSLRCRGISTAASDFKLLGGFISIASLFVENDAECAFEIKDEGGNGNCCGQVNSNVGFAINGGYDILVGADHVVASGGMMGGREVVNFLAQDLQDTVELATQLRLDDFPEQTSWALTCGAYSVQSSQFSARVAGATRLSTLFIEEGNDCQFVIFDEGGNGLCCRDGDKQGFVQIGVDGERVRGTRGDFGPEWRVDFEVILPEAT